MLELISYRNERKLVMALHNIYLLITDKKKQWLRVVTDGIADGYRWSSSFLLFVIITKKRVSRLVMW